MILRFSVPHSKHNGTITRYLCYIYMRKTVSLQVQSDPQ